MKSSVKNLGEILTGGGGNQQRVIPVYQRNYRWGKPQWLRLWEDLVAIEKKPEGNRHFMGFLVSSLFSAEDAEQVRFSLVDGQQRLTTSSILLVAMGNIAKDIGDADRAAEIRNDYLVHKRLKGSEKYRLLPKIREREQYIKLIDEGEAPESAMGKALQFFTEKIGKYVAKDKSKLVRLLRVACNRLEFVNVTLGGENAYEIFRSLNSKNVRLEAADLIRNFVFTSINPQKHDAFDENFWQPLENRFVWNSKFDSEWFSQFFRDRLMSDLRKYVSPAETFDVFGREYQGEKFNKSTMEIMAQTACHYVVVSEGEPDDNSKVQLVLEGLNVLRSPTTYPLLLSLFAKRHNGDIDNDQLALCIEMLRGFIFRRRICGESSRTYGEMFVGAIGRIADSANELAPVDELEKFLSEKGWPNDDQFKAAFVQYPLYKKFHSRQVKSILVAIEHAQKKKERAELDKVEVEHVMPQTLGGWKKALGKDAEKIHEQWIHCPGNLTLSAHNKKISNHLFNKKREEFKKSGFLITEDIAKYRQWGKTEIVKRGKQLAEEAARIWIGPSTK